MFKTHRAALSVFEEFIGGKVRVSNIKQVDINAFFDTLCVIPINWRQIAKTKKLSFRQVAEQYPGVGVSPKTFENGYKSSIRPFLEHSKINFQDQGFPQNLTTKIISYKGSI
jgi:hypothetical protein